MSIHTARQCFEENIQLIDAHTHPVEFNLSQGLRNLCDAVADLDRKLQEIDRKLQVMR